MICSAQDQDDSRLRDYWQVPVGKLRPPKSLRSGRKGALMSGGNAGSGPPSPKYKGVRMRFWGRWVSEIRPPKSRSIWLGSYRSPEEAAYAYDAAVLCLKGPTPTLNFPDKRPAIPPGTPGKYSIKEVQAAAAGAAAAYAKQHSPYRNYMRGTTPSEGINQAKEDHVEGGTSSQPADGSNRYEFDESPPQAAWEVPDEASLWLTPLEQRYDNDHDDGFAREDLPPWDP